MLPCGCCLLSIRDSQAASRFPASPEGPGIITINTDPSHFPAAVTAASWVVGGTGISALLPPGVSLQLAQHCPRAGTVTVKSEEDVNLLTIFAVCVSRQMKLINKGRNVTLSKVLTSKNKYLHRCAGCCQLLGIAMFLDQFMPPHSPSTVSSLLRPSSTVGSFRPWWRAGTAAQREKGTAEPGLLEGECWAPGLFAQKGCLLQPSCFRASFFPSSRMSV